MITISKGLVDIPVLNSHLESYTGNKFEINTTMCFLTFTGQGKNVYVNILIQKETTFRKPLD